MKLTDSQKRDLKDKSPEGICMAIRQIIRDEFGVVDRDEFEEALEDAVESDLLDERDVREFQYGS